jgi:hypothetical protein
MPILCRRMVVSASRRGLRGRPKECQLTFGTAHSEPPRRLRPQPRPRRRLDQGLRAEPSGWATVMNRPAEDRAIVRCRPQGARLRLGSPARLRRTRRHLRARLRRARIRQARFRSINASRHLPPGPRPLGENLPGSIQAIRAEAAFNVSALRCNACLSSSESSGSSIRATPSRPRMLGEQRVTPYRGL